MFLTENARILLFSSLNLLSLPCGRMLPRWWVVFRVVTGKLSYYGTVCARCRNASKETWLCTGCRDNRGKCMNWRSVGTNVC